MTTPRLRALAALSVLAALACACESSNDHNDGYWSGNGSSSSSSDSSSNSSSGDTSADAAPAADQIAYGALRWTYGGIGGGGYSPSGVAISGLKASGNTLSFHYDANLSAWGYGKDAIAAYACLFVQKSDGSWVGGKFDWISSSRSSRDLNNVRGGYEGWSLAGVPNPCPIAFVILDANGKRRSNVVVGTWNR